MRDKLQGIYSGGLDSRQKSQIPVVIKSKTDDKAHYWTYLYHKHRQGHNQNVLVCHSATDNSV